MEPLPRILCVDDEPDVLGAIARVLRREFDVVTAHSGRAGLDIIERDRTFAAVVSDLRMPGMGGVKFLTEVRQIAPDSVRLLLTGQADLDAAVGAVNQGQIFRFLLKPYQATSLMSAVHDAVEQHRLITAERELLEKTVAGSIKALVDLLAITKPDTFGRAIRLKRYVEKIAEDIGRENYWALSVSALLSQVGYIIVPESTINRAQRGERLTTQEEQLLYRLPTFAEQLVNSIPRLEPVRQILRLQNEPARNVDPDVLLDAAILQATMAFDTLEARGMPSRDIVASLERSGRFNVLVLDSIRRLCGLPAPPSIKLAISAQNEGAEPLFGDTEHVVEAHHGIGDSGAHVLVMPLSQVDVGMYFADDVRSANGVLLVARGQEVTESLVQRVRNSWSGFAHALRVRVIHAQRDTVTTLKRAS